MVRLGLGLGLDLQLGLGTLLRIGFGRVMDRVKVWG